MDHELDAADVNAARGDVGGHHDVDLPAGEGPHGPLTRVLAHIALELDGGHARLDELAGQAARQVLGAGEQDALTGPGGQAVHQGVLGGLVRHLPHAVLHGRHRAGGRVDGVVERVVEELLDQGVHPVVQGGREQEALAAGRGGTQDTAHAGQEAEVRHEVGLVNDGGLHLVKVDQPLAHEVQEPAGTGHDDVDPLGQGPLLGLLAHAPEDGGDSHVHHAGQGLNDLGDLEGELTGGGQDQANGVTGAGLVLLRQALDQGQGEGQGLTAAGTSTSQDVAPGEGVGQGGGLDREGGGEAAGRQGGAEVGVHAQVGKSLRCHR